MASMEFHGIHGISWIHELYIVSTKFSWNPRGFHGLHEVSMEPTKFSWNPRTFHGLHEVFMESTMFSWIPQNFHGIHEGRGIHENSPRNFHEVRGIHGKANWILLYSISRGNMYTNIVRYPNPLGDTLKKIPPPITTL